MSREFDILFGRKIKKVYRSFDKLEIGMEDVSTCT
jgi:hypothetical protein